MSRRQWREWRPGLLDNFACRRCGAPPGGRCQTPGGRDARYTHQLRINDWMEWRSKQPLAGWS